jgi:hypothetical protein
MKSIIFLSFFFIFTNFANSQSGDPFTEEKKLTNTEMETAKVLFLKMIDSEDFKEKDRILDELFPMLNKEHDDLMTFTWQGETDQDKIQKWANKNFKPKDVTQATKQITTLIDLWKKIGAENITIYEMLKKASLSEGQEIERPYLERRFGNK